MQTDLDYQYLKTVDIQYKVCRSLQDIEDKRSKEISNLLNKVKKPIHYKLLAFIKLFPNDKNIIKYWERIQYQPYLKIIDEYAEEYVFLQALLDCVTSGDHHVYLNEHEMLMLNKEYV